MRVESRELSAASLRVTGTLREVLIKQGRGQAPLWVPRHEHISIHTLYTYILYIMRVFRPRRDCYASEELSSFIICVATHLEYAYFCAFRVVIYMNSDSSGQRAVSSELIYQYSRIVGTLPFKLNYMPVIEHS